MRDDAIGGDGSMEIYFDHNGDDEESNKVFSILQIAGNSSESLGNLTASLFTKDFDIDSLLPGDEVLSTINPNDIAQEDIDDKGISALNNTGVAAKAIERLYVCDICGNWYTDQNKYVEHVKSHDQLFTTKEFSSQPEKQQQQLASGSNLPLSLLNEIDDITSQFITPNIITSPLQHSSSLGDRFNFDASTSVKYECSSELGIKDKRNGDKQLVPLVVDQPLDNTLEALTLQQYFSSFSVQQEDVNFNDDKTTQLVSYSSDTVFEKGNSLTNHKHHVNELISSMEDLHKAVSSKKKSSHFLIDENILRALLNLDNMKKSNTNKNNYTRNAQFCGHCGLNFSTKLLFREHLWGVNKEQHTRRKVCELCNKTCGSKRHYQNHVMKIHKNRTSTRECYICKQVLCNPQSLRRHLKLHVDSTVYVCCLCGKEVRGAQNLAQHLERSHPHLNCNKIFSCLVCDRYFAREESFEFHLSEHTAIFSTTVHNDTPFKYLCHLCSVGFHYGADMLKHLESRHKSRFYCDDCELTFGYYSEMLCHKNDHENARLIDCSECSLTFPSKFAVSKHVKERHRNIGREETSGAKSNHIEMLCRICNSLVLDKSDARAHTKVHFVNMALIETIDKCDSSRALVKPVKCPFCLRMFADLQFLLFHVDHYFKSSELLMPTSKGNDKEEVEKFTVNVIRNTSCIEKPSNDLNELKKFLQEDLMKTCLQISDSMLNCLSFTAGLENYNDNGVEAMNSIDQTTCYTAEMSPTTNTKNKEVNNAISPTKKSSRIRRKPKKYRDDNDVCTGGGNSNIKCETDRTKDADPLKNDHLRKEVKIGEDCYTSYCKGETSSANIKRKGLNTKIQPTKTTLTAKKKTKKSCVKGVPTSLKLNSEAENKKENHLNISKNERLEIRGESNPDKEVCSTKPHYESSVKSGNESDLTTTIYAAPSSTLPNHNASHAEVGYEDLMQIPMAEATLTPGDDDDDCRKKTNPESFKRTTCYPVENAATDIEYKKVNNVLLQTPKSSSRIRGKPKKFREEDVCNSKVDSNTVEKIKLTQVEIVPVNIKCKKLENTITGAKSSFRIEKKPKKYKTKVISIEKTDPLIDVRNKPEKMNVNEDDHISNDNWKPNVILYDLEDTIKNNRKELVQSTEKHSTKECLVVVDKETPDSMLIGLSERKGTPDSMSIGLSERKGTPDSMSIGLSERKETPDLMSIGLSERKGTPDSMSIGLSESKETPDSMLIGLSERKETPDSMLIGLSESEETPDSMLIGLSENPTQKIWSENPTVQVEKVDRHIQDTEDRPPKHLKKVKIGNEMRKAHVKHKRKELVQSTEKHSTKECLVVVNKETPDSMLIGLSESEETQHSMLIGLSERKETPHSMLIGLSERKETPDSMLIGLSENKETPDSMLIGLSESKETPDSMLIGLSERKETPDSMLIGLSESKETPDSMLIGLSENPTQKIWSENPTVEVEKVDRHIQDTEDRPPKHLKKVKIGNEMRKAHGNLSPTVLLCDLRRSDNKITDQKNHITDQNNNITDQSTNFTDRPDNVVQQDEKKSMKTFRRHKDGECRKSDDFLKHAKQTTFIPTRDENDNKKPKKKKKRSFNKSTTIELNEESSCSMVLGGKRMKKPILSGDLSKLKRQKIEEDCKTSSQRTTKEKQDCVINPFETPSDDPRANSQCKLLNVAKEDFLSIKASEKPCSHRIEPANTNTMKSSSLSGKRSTKSLSPKQLSKLKRRKIEEDCKTSLQICTEKPRSHRIEPANTNTTKSSSLSGKRPTKSLSPKQLSKLKRRKIVDCKTSLQICTAPQKNQGERVILTKNRVCKSQSEHIHLRNDSRSKKPHKSSKQCNSFNDGVTETKHEDFVKCLLKPCNHDIQASSLNAQANNRNIQANNHNIQASSCTIQIKHCDRRADYSFASVGSKCSDKKVKLCSKFSDKKLKLEPVIKASDIMIKKKVDKKAVVEGTSCLKDNHKNQPNEACTASKVKNFVLLDLSKLPKESACTCRRTTITTKTSCQGYYKNNKNKNCLNCIERRTNMAAHSEHVLTGNNIDSQCCDDQFSWNLQQLQTTKTSTSNLDRLNNILKMKPLTNINMHNHSQPRGIIV